MTGLKKDGTRFPVHLSVGEMVSEGKRSFTGILHDLSDRVALEQRLAEQKSLAKLGEMAAVVAHEVKNPIAGIRGALQVITSRMPADQRDRAILLDIITRLDALNRIVQDMLMFARPRALRQEPVPLGSLLRETAALIERDPGMPNLEIGVTGSADIVGDREMLQVVFQNILMNAAQAMDGQGRIDVTIAAADGRCRVAIADRGPGHAGRSAREGVRRVLHDEASRNRPRTSHREARGRSPRRDDADRRAAAGRHDYFGRPAAAAVAVAPA